MSSSEKQDKKVIKQKPYLHFDDLYFPYSMKIHMLQIDFLQTIDISV